VIRVILVPVLTAYLHDLIGILFLAVAALILGLTINRFSSNPVSLAYLSPEQRLRAELTMLVEAPPFQLADVRTVGLDDFRKSMVDEHALVFDARPSVYYSEGHVPGALNLSRNDFAKDYTRLRPVLDKDKNRPIIVYCSGGDCHDSRLVASALLALGFSNVKIFTGGWTSWTEAKLPVERE
jgi:rhodanese-related sulfurtransferase